ncbi:MAG: hypothetical protein M9962_01000 [Oligoflexia bacterium]|nr:hypothetical protein [Oligoflexia bacterium]
MKILITTILLLILFQGTAQAEAFILSCGIGADQGIKAAELSLVDDPEKTLEIYEKGKVLQKGEYGTASRGELWIVTIFGQRGALDRKYEINLNNQTVKEFIIDDKDVKPLGKTKKCKIHETSALRSFDKLKKSLLGRS